MGPWLRCLLGRAVRDWKKTARREGDFEIALLIVDTSVNILRLLKAVPNCSVNVIRFYMADKKVSESAEMRPVLSKNVKERICRLVANYNGFLKRRIRN